MGSTRSSKIAERRKARPTEVKPAIPTMSKTPKKAVTEGYTDKAVSQIVLRVTQKTVKDLEHITGQSFQLIMARFDRIEDQNTEQTRLLAEHKLVDDTVHDIVKKHEGYWNVIKWGAGPTGIGAAIATWLGFHSK